METKCGFLITPKDDSICQLRIDFDAFEMDAGSGVDKPCDRDYLEVFTEDHKILGEKILNSRVVGV